MKKIMTNSILIFTILVFSVIFIFSFFYESNVYYKTNFLMSLLFSGIILCFWFISYKGLKKINYLTKKKEINLLLFYFIIVSVIQIIVLKNLSVAPSWDFGMVFSNASSFVATGVRNLQVYPEYLQLFPNNIMLFIFLVIFIKFGSFFGLTAIHSAYLMNILFIDLSLFVLFLVTKKMFDNKNAFFSLLVSFFFLPLFLYTPIFYTDTVSLFIAISFIYVYLHIDFEKSLNCKNIFLFIFFGILLFLGKEIKITSIFIFVAIFLDFIFNHKSIKLLANFLISLVIFIILLFLFKIFIVQNQRFQFKVNDYGSVPYTHWIMMGVEDIDKDNSARNSYGGYNSDDYILTESYDNGSLAIKFNIKEYIERVKKMGTFKYSNFLIKKAVNTWTDGFYFSDVKLSINSYHKEEKLYNILFVNEKSKNMFISFSQGVQYAFLITLILGSGIKLKKKELKIDYIRLTILGLFIFFLFWENRSRYLLNYIPIFILVIIETINLLNRKKGEALC